MKDDLNIERSRTWQEISDLNYRLKHNIKQNVDYDIEIEHDILVEMVWALVIKCKYLKENHKDIYNELNEI